MQQLALALGVLTRGVRYRLAPGQDLRFDLARMPTQPRSGVVLEDVRVLDGLDDRPGRPPSPGAARDAATAERIGEVGALAAIRSATSEPAASP